MTTTASNGQADADMNCSNGNDQREYATLRSFKPFTTAMVQLGDITEDKTANLAHTAEMLRKAGRGNEDYPKVDLLILPEIFNSPMDCSAHARHCEIIPDTRPGEKIQPEDLPLQAKAPSSHMLSQAARETGCWIIGGSIPEQVPAEEGGLRIGNTLTVWDDQGCLVAKYRKIHLYDVHVPGAIKVTESDTVASGDRTVVVETPFGMIALAICYDIRFPDLIASIMKQCPDICAWLIPSAFNHISGPLAWELLQRARAIDNQIYVGMCSPARDDSADYICYGHSMLVAPNGQICSTPTPRGEPECIVYAKLDPAQLKRTRQYLPVGKHQRPDVYSGSKLLKKVEVYYL